MEREEKKRNEIGEKGENSAPSGFFPNYLQSTSRLHRLFLIIFFRIPLSLRTRGEIELDEAKTQHEKFVGWEIKYKRLSLCTLPVD